MDIMEAKSDFPESFAAEVDHALENAESSVVSARFARMKTAAQRLTEGS